MPEQMARAETVAIPSAATAQAEMAEMGASSPVTVATADMGMALATVETEVQHLATVPPVSVVTEVQEETQVNWAARVAPAETLMVLATGELADTSSEVMAAEDTVATAAKGVATAATVEMGTELETEVEAETLEEEMGEEVTVATAEA